MRRRARLATKAASARYNESLHERSNDSLDYCGEFANGPLGSAQQAAGLSRGSHRGSFGPAGGSFCDERWQRCRDGDPLPGGRCDPVGQVEGELKIPAEVTLMDRLVMGGAVPHIVELLHAEGHVLLPCAEIRMPEWKCGMG